VERAVVTVAPVELEERAVGGNAPGYSHDKV
jgi:hypothetical protein